MFIVCFMFEKEFKLKTVDLLSIWPLLCTTVDSQLNIVSKLSKNKQIDQLCKAVHDLYMGSKSIKVHVFGSQVYGLATEKSDVDLYLEIGIPLTKLLYLLFCYVYYRIYIILNR